MNRLRPGDRLVLATHNGGKLAELTAALAPTGVELVTAASLGLPEPEENAPDFVGNARLKARAARAAGLPALADDSGFCVAALGGAPGVHSARWAGPGKDFAAAMRRVYEEAKDAEDKRAWFVCVLCFAWLDGTESTYVARAEGTWTWPPRGDRGFGYDPMFVPHRQTLTFGEMDEAAKQGVSHRARALAQIMAACFDPAP